MTFRKPTDYGAAVRIYDAGEKYADRYTILPPRLAVRDAPTTVGASRTANTVGANLMELHDMLPDLRRQCLKRPSSFAMFDRSRPWFEPNGWGFTDIGTHREADTLTRSNWEVITRDLLARFPDAFEVVHTSHCLVGWYDHLAVDTSNEAAMLALAEWDASLSDYPVADESHFSELEYTEACDYWARMSVAERVEALQQSRARCSVFAARRDTLPDDDNGHLFDYLIRS